MLIIASLLIFGTVAAAICLYHYIGMPKCIGEKKYKYKTKKISVTYGNICLYGKALVPISNKGKKFKTVIYAHGALSSHKTDISTLKSLAKSGVACYTFDFYGWTSKSTGPKGAKWFKNTPISNTEAYAKMALLQVNDLNAVIEKVKSFDFIDADNVYLLGSSMGSATAAACAANCKGRVKGLVLQYPAMFLNEQAYETGAKYNVGRYCGPVLILQGGRDKLVPVEQSARLADYYNCEKKHCKMIVYDNQPHVFRGKYKAVAARNIYEFINSCA